MLRLEENQESPFFFLKRESPWGKGKTQENLGKERSIKKNQVGKL